MILAAGVMVPGAVLGWLALVSAGEQQAVLEGRTASVFFEAPPLAAAEGEPALGDLGQTLTRFEDSLTRDTAYNVAFFLPRVRRWIAEGQTDPEALEERVYREIFQTPLDDPWLGLVPANTYAALEANGLFLADAPTTGPGAAPGEPLSECR